jgi:hypothetical protein
VHSRSYLKKKDGVEFRRKQEALLDDGEVVEDGKVPSEFADTN